MQLIIFILLHLFIFQNFLKETMKSSFFLILRKRENTLGHATLSVELLFEGILLFLLLPLHLFFFSILILPKKPCRFSVNYVTFPDERLIITFSAASHRHETIMRFVEIRNLSKKDISTKEKKKPKENTNFFLLFIIP